MARSAIKPPVYSQRLVDLMAECEWRDEDLAVASDVSARTIGNLRAGRQPSMRRATAICLAQAFSKQLRRRVSADFVRGEAA